MLGLLHHIINSYHHEEDGQIRYGKGLPMGIQTSQWFALYYLDPMDRLIKEKMRIRHYVRYMDNGALIHESKEYLQETLQRMREMADKLKLDFNQKTQIFPLRMGLDFVGFHFYLTDTGKVVKRLRTSNKRRFKRRLHKFQKDYRANKKSLADISVSIRSYNGHFKHGHTYKLRQHLYKRFILTKAPRIITLPECT